jgi:hypothetical protein
MAGQPSAYAALGLEPDADSAAIDRAYKDLIKRHHPDRAGGDARRAAEIIQAYRELRGSAARDALEFNDFEGLAAKPRFTRAALPIAAVGAILILVLTSGPVSRLKGVPSLPLGKVASGGVADPMEQSLDLAAVDRGVQDALRLSRSSDEMTLATATRDCHHQLRLRPSFVQLDRCAAFDDAVVVLQDRDPLRDQGPFSELAVTGRQWSGAQTLSNDNLAIDGRLDRIRLRVELALAPVEPPLPPLQSN